ncbi:MAG: hypothetical protein Q4C04_05665 [Clostridia bacterium]|nr:hypothetical protein [Clostridia bacterium]
MIIYSAIMLVVAIPFLIFAVLIYRGQTSLIHIYHQRRVAEKDKPAYARAVAKCLFAITGALIASGIVGLFGESRTVVVCAVAILFAGFIPPIVMFIRVQKRYNGGLW